MNLFLKEINYQISFKKFIAIFIFSLLVTGFETFFFSLESLSYALPEFAVVSLVLIATTSSYERYNNALFMKMNSLNNNSKQKLKAYLFITLTLYGIYVFAIFVSAFFLGVAIGMISSAPFFPSFGDFSNESVNWSIIWKNSKDSFVFYFYAILLEIIIAIVFGYTLNHFIKDKFLLHGLLILIIIYFMAYGAISMNRTNIEVIDGIYYLVPNRNDFRTLMNALIFPWNQVGMIAKNALNDDYINIKWWDYSHMNIYRFNLLTPYISIILMLGLSEVF